MRRSPAAVSSVLGLNLKRGPWTAEEDQLLSTYIKREGEGRWRTLPNRAGLLRCGKSCRLRWMNYLRPSVKRGQIAPDEEDLILRLHRLLGNRWALIAGRISGRTDNEIKNYWNTHLSKKLIGQGIDPRTHKPLIISDQDHHHNSKVVMINSISNPNHLLTDQYSNPDLINNGNNSNVIHLHQQQQLEENSHINGKNIDYGTTTTTSDGHIINNGGGNEDTFSSFLNSLINEDMFNSQLNQQPNPNGDFLANSLYDHHDQVYIFGPGWDQADHPTVCSNDPSLITKDKLINEDRLAS